MLIYQRCGSSSSWSARATDGFVPYRFLDPANGDLSVAIYSVAIAGFILLFGYAVYGLSRVRILKP